MTTPTTPLTSVRPSARPVAVAHGSVLRPLLWLVLALLAALVFVVFRANRAREVQARAEPVSASPAASPDAEEAEETPSAVSKRERVRPRIRPGENGKGSLAGAGKEGAAPPASAAGATQGEAAPPGAAPPADARALLAGIDVTLYTTSWCGYCKKARSLLVRNGITFRERDIERDPSAESDFRHLNSDGGVPTFDIEGDVFTGYSPERVANSLERAIYAESGQRAEIRFTGP